MSPIGSALLLGMPVAVALFLHVNAEGISRATTETTDGAEDLLEDVSDGF